MYPEDRVGGIDEVILQRRCHRRAGALQVIDAGRRWWKHLTNAIDIGEQRALLVRSA